MSVGDRLLALVAPHECLGGCGAEGPLLCISCTESVPRLVPQCYRCGKFSVDWRTCPTCRRRSKLFSVRSVMAYEKIAKDLVWKLKFEGAQAAAGTAARLMAAMLPEVPEGAIITYVPTATSRVRQRGYDQARLLACRLPRAASVRCLPCLRCLDQHRQVGASAAVRRQQLASSFRVCNAAQIRGAHIILVDDVITTGATLEAAAAVLKQAGAKRIDAIAFAKA